MTNKLTPNSLATKPGDVWFDELRKGAIRATKILALENINAKAFVPVLLAEIEILRGLLEVAREALEKIRGMTVHGEKEQAKKGIFWDWRDEARKALKKIGG